LPSVVPSQRLSYPVIYYFLKSSPAPVTLMAPTTEILDEVVHRCELLLDMWMSKEGAEIAEADDSEEYADCDEAESLLVAPPGSSKLGLFFHYCLLPLKALMHFTIPDVRGRDADPIGAATTSCIMCIVWLIVGSYFMVWSLEYLAALMNIPDSIVGVTVSAAGTSLPNYVASQVAARQGLGNMAVSNAFGSNVFNIFVGLGVPWLLYITFVNNGEDYTDLVDDGIVANVLIMASVLLFFVVLMLTTGFVLVRWHAYAFLTMYSVYVIYNVGLVYFW
jgi:Ca2+/Na+ antiporter